MFSVANANAIAYDDLMVHGRGRKKDFVAPFGDSIWIDVTDGHWIAAEGKLAHCMVRQIRASHTCGVYVISPFRAVAEGFSDLLANDGSPDGEDWAKANSGTVHTFQGKQSDIVILVLGSDPQSNGARQWAASKPNLLSVALTQAKERVYVIGNRSLWAEQTYFALLAETLPTTTRQAFESKWLSTKSPTQTPR
jgi:hypothetical protein